MKTTVEIADSLLAQARRKAAREKTTVRKLIEEGLRKVLSDGKDATAFKLRKASFAGEGLHPDAEGADWGGLRDRIYQGRGA